MTGAAASSLERESTPAHHAPGGGFRNPWPAAELHGFKDFLKWRFGGEAPPRVPSPAYGSLPTRAPAIIAPRAARGHRTATWVGHSTVLLQLGALTVLTDPMWSERASPVQWAGPKRAMPPGVNFGALPEIDVVLLSHNHYDHLDSRTVRRIAKRWPGARWLCPLGLERFLRKRGVREIIQRDWWQSVDLDQFSATCTPAQHFSSRTLRDRNATLWCGWVLEHDGARVYFAGDTALHPEFGAIGERLGPFDLVLMPIGAYDPRWFMRAVHMDPEDAVAAYQALTAKADDRPPCLAIHWGTFRLTDEPMDEPPARFTAAWETAGLPAARAWTLAFGETRAF